MHKCVRVLSSYVFGFFAVDCIDCAADGAVINAVNEGIEAARAITPVRRPWVMISVNDHEDLHFRKARNFHHLSIFYADNLVKRSLKI